MSELFNSLKLTVVFSSETMKDFYINRVDYVDKYQKLKKRKNIELDDERFFLLTHDDLYNSIGVNSGFFISLEGYFLIDGKAMIEIIRDSFNGVMANFNKKIGIKPRIDSLELKGVTKADVSIFWSIDFQDEEEQIKKEEIDKEK